MIKNNDLVEAKKETPFSADDLALDIEPLLRGYFVGEFVTDGNKIICKFLNGQKFYVTVEEEK